ncbi:MAG: leucine-rich repeat protein, partial [Bacteroidaceae bacterium]|nr:leucine-rich repeat protein [Bacteroidaceae bacterium]
MKSINANAFNGCTILKSIEIPSSVTSIASTAFNGCNNLTTMTVVGGTTFSSPNNNCIVNSSMTLIAGCKATTIPTSSSVVTSIGANAFKNITTLTSITVPSNIQTIGSDAFSGCSGLTAVISLGAVPPTLSSGSFSGISSNCILYVPYGKKSAYTGADWTEGTNGVFKGGVVELDVNNFLTITVPTNAVYTGEAHTATISPKSGSTPPSPLVEDTDYTISHTANINVGQVTVTVTGAGLYAGTSMSATFDIAQAPVTVKADDKEMTYGGTVPELTAAVTGLVEGESESLISYNAPSCTANSSSPVGTYPITVTGETSQGNYTVSYVEGTLTITQASISTLTISDIPAQTYDGTQKTPTFNIYNGDTQVANLTYNVTYGENINAGDEAGTITVTGTGNYTGTLTASFTIEPKPADDDFAVAEIAAQTYTGSALTPDVTVTDGENTLTSDDYDVSYANNTAVGEA